MGAQEGCAGVVSADTCSALSEALQHLHRASTLAEEHGAARVGLKSLPLVNQTRVPEASEPEMVAGRWLNRFLSVGDESCVVGDEWGEAPRYNGRLVSEHEKRCERCTAAKRCPYGDLLSQWITYGVDLRVLCTQLKPSQYPRKAIVQSEKANSQLEHLAALSATGVVQQSARRALECVGNVFLVGVEERPSGLSGVEAIAVRTGRPELARGWQKVVQSTAKERLVMDLRGLNRVTHEWEFKYDHLLRIASRYAAGDKFAVLDLSSAFHLIPIAKSAWPLLGLKLRERYWNCTRLPFGYSAAPAICSVVTGELARLVEQMELVKGVCCYVDDFFVLLKSEAKRTYLSEMIEYLRTMGAVVAPEKCQFGTEVTFVGFRVRGTASGLQISMRDEKRERLKAELQVLQPLIMHDTSGALGPALEMLSGRLQWYWPALANSYAWLEPVHSWRRHVARLATMGPEERTHIQEKLAEALGWWLNRVDRASNSWTALGGTGYTELAVVDASGPDVDGQFSYGGILWRLHGSTWARADAWRGLECMGGASTQDAELAAILDAWQRMTTTSGLVVSDSTAAVTAAARGYTRHYGHPINEQLRVAMEMPGRLRRVIWTPRAENTAADALSRPQVSS